MVHNELGIFIPDTMLVAHNHDHVIRVVLAVSLHKVDLDLGDFLELLEVPLVGDVVLVFGREF